MDAVALKKKTKTKKVSYSELKTLVSTKGVRKVDIGQSYIRAVSNDGQTIYTTRVVKGDTKLVESLDKEGIERDQLVGS